MAIEWSFVRHLAIRLSVALERIELQQDTGVTRLGKFGGKFKFTSSGGLLYLNFYF